MYLFAIVLYKSGPAESVGMDAGPIYKVGATLRIFRRIQIQVNKLFRAQPFTGDFFFVDLLLMLYSVFRCIPFLL
jgi:hypothetical protein